MFSKRTFIFFFLTALLIILLHFLYHPVRVLGMDTSIFYMDERITLAAFYTTIISFLIGFLSIRSDKWLNRIFGAFFLILSADEYFEMHEYANTLVKEMLVDTNSMGRLAEVSWIFPLFVLVILVFIMFTVMIIREKRNDIRIPLVLGLLSYVIVLVLEVSGGQTFGQDIYVTFVGAEEGLEMIGGSFFLLSVFNRIKS